MSLKFNTIAITTCLMLTACGGNDHSSSEVPQPQPQPQPQPYDILDKSNYVTAYKFQERYNLTNINCGDDSLPSYHCSGVIFRGIRSTAQPKPWKHRDKDKTKGVLSLAYIDKDLNFKLPEDTYQAGIIIKPDFEKNITVECASPMDMNTDSRISSYSNCLQSTEIKYSQIDYTVKSCQAWGIDSAQKWLDIFIPIMRETKNKGSLDQFPGQTCSFTMSKDQQDRAKYFNIFSDIRKNIPNDLHPAWWNDEILVKTWDDTDSRTAPIEAFYYNFGNKQGLDSAQKFQQSYYDDTKILLPIISIDFKEDGNSKFLYSQHDQAVLEKQNLTDVNKAKTAVKWLIPEPPKEDSDTFNIDKTEYENLQSIDIQRWNLAVSDADYRSNYLLNRFTKDLNPKLNNQKILSFINYIVNFEQPVVNDIKQQYMRKRPFQYYNTSSCTPNEDKDLEKNGSYPSGHSLRGYLVASALSDIDISMKDQFNNVAKEYAQSRMVCRAHWESDTYAAQKISTILMNILHFSPEYLLKVQESKIVNN